MSNKGGSKYYFLLLVFGGIKMLSFILDTEESDLELKVSLVWVAFLGLTSVSDLERTLVSKVSRFFLDYSPLYLM